MDNKDDVFTGIADHRKTEFEKNGEGGVDMKLYMGMSDCKAMHGTTDDATLKLRHTLTMDGSNPQIPMVPHSEEGIEQAKTGMATIRKIISNPARRLSRVVFQQPMSASTNNRQPLTNDR